MRLASFTHAHETYDHRTLSRPRLQPSHLTVSFSATGKETYLILRFSTPRDTAPCILPVADSVTSTSALTLLASPEPVRPPRPLTFSKGHIQLIDVPLGTAPRRRRRRPLPRSHPCGAEGTDGGDPVPASVCG